MDIKEEEISAVVCVRLADLAKPEDMPNAMLRDLAEKVRARSDVEQCSHCGEDVIVDNTTSPRAPPRICIECAMDWKRATKQ